MAYQSAHSGLPDKMKSEKRKRAKDKEEEEEEEEGEGFGKFSAVYDSTRQMHTLPVHKKFFR